MTHAERWLQGRLAKAPPALVASMIAALPEAEATARTVPEVLIQAALGLYGSVARGSGGREDALPLLAADALFTHAFEAQAELNPHALDGLVERCGRDLGEVLP